MNPRYLTIASLFLSILILPSPACAFTTPHPLQQFERGMQLLQQYSGDPARLVQAENIFTKSMQEFPDSPLGYVGMSRVGIIQAYLYADHYDLLVLKQVALPFATKALELGPSVRLVHENYAIFEKIFATYEMQRKELKQELVENPDSAKTYIKLAELLRDQEEYSKAIDYYKIAFGLETDEAVKVTVIKRIALIYLEGLKRPVAAIGYLKQAATLCPSCADVQEYLGRAYLELGKYQLAVDKLTKAGELLRTPFTEYYLQQAQGYLSQEHGDFLQAINFLEKASEFPRQDFNLYLNLGNLYYRVGKYEEAYAQFQKVIDLNPENSGAYYFAGRSASELGKRDIAIGLFRKYLQLKTDTPEAQWIRQNIPDLSHK